MWWQNKFIFSIRIRKRKPTPSDIFPFFRPTVPDRLRRFGPCPFMITSSLDPSKTIGSDHIFIIKQIIMKKIVRLTEADLTRLVKRVIEEQSLSDLGKKVKSYGENLSGKVPPYWGKLKNMTPKPTVETSNLLQKTLGGSAEVLKWENGNNVLGVHSDGTVEIIIGGGTPGSNGSSGKQQKQIDSVGSILRAFGVTPNWENMHEGERYVEIEGLNPNQILTLVNSSSRFLK